MEVMEAAAAGLTSRVREETRGEGSDGVTSDEKIGRGQEYTPFRGEQTIKIFTNGLKK